MRLQEITLRYFKNYQDQTARFHPKLTLFYGGNGVGKTNLLEAVYYLSTLKPFRPGELIQWGENQAYIQGLGVLPEGEEKFSIRLSQVGPREIRIGEKTVSSLREYLPQHSIVTFLPNHLQMVQGPPEDRRDYLDRAVYTNDFKYLYTFRRYKHLLAQRNTFLKDPYIERDKGIWDEQFLQAGLEVIKYRIGFIKKIAPLVSEIYSSLSPIQLTLSIQYDMARDGLGEDEELEKKSRYRLKMVAAEEQVRRCSQWGPHRHDLQLHFQGRPLAVAGSQGQQRLAILALKLAEVELLNQSQVPPLVLLDDLASELDPPHRSYVMQYLQRHQQQIILTASDPNHWPVDNFIDCQRYEVQKGRVSEIG